ncbi:hypothetical protein K402DRAFT_165003 [Aulographum hederae CBS 113979]|uniref:Uncharacterized protein n=1 Tax=Aulographum hederae CBS 113979 TaxID=1176131 RepID=A0A6G1GS14_9PEZI|nr:hypothetical protein K402DRAFT_165003 [Aulographum hederae CBS 113979]
MKDTLELIFRCLARIRSRDLILEGAQTLVACNRFEPIIKERLPKLINLFPTTPSDVRGGFQSQLQEIKEEAESLCRLDFDKTKTKRQTDIDLVDGILDDTTDIVDDIFDKKLKAKSRRDNGKRLSDVGDLLISLNDGIEVIIGEVNRVTAPVLYPSIKSSFDQSNAKLSDYLTTLESDSATTIPPSTAAQTKQVLEGISDNIAALDGKKQFFTTAQVDGLWKGVKNTVMVTETTIGEFLALPLKDIVAPIVEEITANAGNLCESAPVRIARG